MLNQPRDTTQYLIHGSKYGRLASRKLFNTFGGNLQNKDNSLKKLYWADDGKVINQRDQSGAEALIVAYLCRDGNYRALFKNKIKVHTFVAMHVFATQLIEHIVNDGLDLHCDIEELLKTPIPLLNKNPWWKPLAKLIADTDEWPDEVRYYYIAKQICHCVDEQTEVLTDSGWKSISQSMLEHCEIAVWNKDDESIKFETPQSFFSAPYQGEMIRFNEPELDQFVTPDHKLPHWQKNKFVNFTAETLLNKKDVRIPNSGKYIGGNKHLKRHEIQLLAAIQADGNIYGKGRVRFRFQKERKAERLKEILFKGNFNFKMQLKDVYEFYVWGIEKLLEYFQPKKLWGKWLLDFSSTNLHWLIHELSFWDGSWEEEYLHKRECYRTKFLENAEWIKTICHLVGKQGTINKSSDGSIYIVGINSRTKSRVTNKSKTTYNGMIYCPTVSTGYFLIRRNGKISITHNSGNYGATFMMLILNTLDKSNGRILIPVKDAKRHLEMYHGLFPEIQQDFQAYVIHCVEETGMLYNLLGHPITFTGRRFNAQDQWKEWYAAIPQSTVAMITRIAIIKMQSFIEDSGVDWDILPCDTHDSFAVQSPVDESEQCQRIMKSFIEPELTNFKGEKFQMRSEGATGKCWAKYSSTFVDGLKKVDI